jgi:magnesium transporter
MYKANGSSEPGPGQDAGKVRESAKAGLPPGTMVHIGKQRQTPARLTLMEYDAQQFTEEELASPEECLPFLDAPTVTWLNIAGLNDLDAIAVIGQHLNLHPLLLEDLVDTSQRPKVEDYGPYLFIIVKMLDYAVPTEEVEVEQVSLIVGKDYVVSFQEDEDDVFDGVRDRIRSGKGRIRTMGADYLAYALIDAVVDNYFHVLERIGEDTEGIEEVLLEESAQEVLQVLSHLKREMVAVRRAVWPLRDVLAILVREETPLIQPETRIYLRDVYDHTVQMIDVIESEREGLSSMLDVYLTSVSNRTNEIVKVLTIFSAIFIPLTFLAGVYGMNFQYFPEITWRWGYPLFWVMAGVIAGLLLIYLRRKRWL